MTTYCYTNNQVYAELYDGYVDKIPDDWTWLRHEAYPSMHCQNCGGEGKIEMSADIYQFEHRTIFVIHEGDCPICDIGVDDEETI